ncbi:NTP transferase domain-containing protein [Sphingomonas albertensis]|uniref:Phosphocholine cytidylyltransferase family protein n=1 Tax=Sphingomonas albertensis TaxID=2762591 RepID=A0ABR7AKD5_9SPHN|nr:phosphocholine cytidylyltransferase family protein [Sphingomonas albertensis]MBC3940910.1 phosphocholine cytidylyltransferase family protein [Sphingomonas albertensis]
MKAIILAAGHGSRLLPLTLTTPKCLVEVGGRAILDHQLDAVAAAGFEGAVVVGGYRIDQIAAHLSARDGGLPTELVFNPFWGIANSIGSVWAARAYLDAPFALMNGDTVFDAPILRAAVSDPVAGVKLVIEPLAEPGLDDMLVEADGDRIVAVGKHLVGHEATARSLGLIVSTGGTTYADALRAVIGEEDGIHAYHHAVVRRAAETVGVRAVRIAGDVRWQEIDRPEDIALWQHDHDALAGDGSGA